MDAAKAAIHKITSRTGHTTDVKEVVNPGVTSHTIKPHRHEETTEAIDREVHQDHYHTTVQPIEHKETLPEQHTHNLASQINKEFKHDNERETQARVSAEHGQFKNTSVTHNTTHTTQAAPAVTGEHVHHHVHETVQPVIHKQTIQPEVVHTTIPVHEVHTATAQHHGMSALPMKTLDEFSKSGGVITGNTKTTHEEYQGAPRPYNEKLKTTIENVMPGHHGSSTGTTSTVGTGSHTGVGSHTGIGSQTGTTSHTGIGSHTGTSSSDTYSTGTDGRRRPDSGVGGVGSGTSHGKPSLADKLNPSTDADRDGKRGVMD